MSTHITTSGNLAADPDHGVSDSGVAWARFTLIRNDRHKDRAGEWVDGPPQQYRITCFRRLADNVAASLHKGDAATVAGTFVVSEYVDRDGNRRRSNDITADAVGADLTYATVAVTRNTKPADTQDGPFNGADPNPPF